MRVAFISDVHGNAVAFEACLGAIRRLRVDQIHFLGDAVGYLPDEISVLDRLAAEGIACQQGNHEAMLLAEPPVNGARDTVYRLAAARARLFDTPHWVQIRGWPTSVTREIGGRRFLMVHGSPVDELFGYVHQDTDLSPFSHQPVDVVVMANTHRPWIREVHGRTFVNTGSVGLPRDHGTLAAFAIFDADARALRIMRVPIDTKEILRRYGSDLATEVRQCFSRRSQQLVGEVVA